MKQGEGVFLAALMIFSAASLWQAFQIAGFSKWASPGVFPMLASTVMLVSALFILANYFRRSRHQQPHAKLVLDTLPALPTRVAVITVLLLLYIIAMPVLGFLICSGLFLFASISYLWNKSVWLSLLVSVLSLLVIHSVFRLAFQVILPKGTLLTALS